MRVWKNIFVKREPGPIDFPKMMKMTIEQVFRKFLASLDGSVVAHAPPIPVFRGQGVQPEVDLTDNAALEDLMSAEP